VAPLSLWANVMRIQVAARVKPLWIVQVPEQPEIGGPVTTTVGAVTGFDEGTPRACFEWKE